MLGMMSGTSADGIDVALVRISGAPPAISAKFEAHHHVPFTRNVREAILRLANGSADDHGGNQPTEFRARRRIRAGRDCGVQGAGSTLEAIDLIGSHGQTVFHQGAPARLVGRLARGFHAANRRSRA